MTPPFPANHPDGETTGSPERAAQRLSGRGIAFDLNAEAAQLRFERPYREGHRNANTLVKADNFRVVLTALRAGSRLQEHQTAGWAAIQALRGRLRIKLADGATELPAGHLLALAPGEAHDVEALEDSEFLLTLAGPPDRTGD